MKTKKKSLPYTLVYRDHFMGRDQRRYATAGVAMTQAAKKIVLPGIKAVWVFGPAGEIFHARNQKP